ncbi:hypothetical protein PABG_11987 [Paracoccidioides brasiliensis Pb03]|nr:hypothetical protein PABG_11987 [Paracoccidioides brasiliensis Pb03]
MDKSGPQPPSFSLDASWILFEKGQAWARSGTPGHKPARSSVPKFPLNDMIYWMGPCRELKDGTPFGTYVVKIFTAIIVLNKGNPRYIFSRCLWKSWLSLPDSPLNSLGLTPTRTSSME